jgi:hypothetical protein
MKLFLAACVAAAVLAGSPSARAAPELRLSMTTAPNGTYLLDQDSPDNSISVWQIDRLSNVNAIRAKLTVRRVGGGHGANPTFGLSLANGSDTVMFQAFTKPGKTTFVPLINETSDHTEKSGLAGGVFLSLFELNETVDLEVSWTAAGEVTVTLRDKASRAINDFERHTVTMRGGPPTSLKVVAISGEAEWKPLEIGTANSQ